MKKKTKKIIGENLADLRYGNDVLDRTTKVEYMKEIVDKQDFITIKKNCSVKDNMLDMH